MRTLYRVRTSRAEARPKRKRGRVAARVAEKVGFRRKCKRCRLSRGAVLSFRYIYASEHDNLSLAIFVFSRVIRRAYLLTGHLVGRGKYFGLAKWLNLVNLSNFVRSEVD